jgi:hypothetical protein
MESMTERRTRFAELLVREGFISEQQLREVLHHNTMGTSHMLLRRSGGRPGIHFKTLLRGVLDRYRKHRELGNVLLRMGVALVPQLRKALSLQKKTQKGLGQALPDKGSLTKAELAEALCIQFGIPKIAPNVYMVDPLLLAKATPEYFRRHRVVPVNRIVLMSGDKNKENVTVLMENPFDTAAVADLGRVFNAEIQPAVSATMDIEEFLNEIFGPQDGYHVATMASDPRFPAVHHQTEEIPQGRNDIPASPARREQRNCSLLSPDVQENGGRPIGRDGTMDVKILPRVKEQGSPSFLKPHRIAVAALALLLLVAGAVTRNVWLRPPVISTGPNKPTQTHAIRSERVPVEPGIEKDPLRQATDVPERTNAQNSLKALWWAQPVLLRGEIAHGLHLEMRLVREGSKLSGSYSYTRFGKDIPLQGRMDETGGIVLEEFVKGHKSGTFTGKVVSDARVEGKWSKPGSTKPRDFFLVGATLPSGNLRQITPVKQSPLRDHSTP